MHLGRAAAIFWVAAVLLPAAAAEAGAVRQPSTSKNALLGVSSSPSAGTDRIVTLIAKVGRAEDDVHDVVARLRLETERFIAKLP
jgi:hypothetical protein